MAFHENQKIREYKYSSEMAAAEMDELAGEEKAEVEFGIVLMSQAIL